MQKDMVIQNKYRLIKQISSVWLAADLRGGQMRILKKESSFTDPDVVEILKQVWHPGVPRLLEKVNSDEGQWLAFEYIEGQTLEEKIIAGEHGLAEDTALSIMLQMAKILDFLHRQLDKPLLHLDIKPANIVFTETGEAALIDFNSAKLYVIGQTNEVALVSCTADYAAPELLRKKPCPASDIYSLALSVIELIRGEKIFRGQSINIEDILKENTPSIQLLLRKCLHADPEKRISSAGELAYEILQIQGSTDKIEHLPAVAAGKGKSVSKKTGEEKNGSIICVWGGAEFGCEMASFLADNKEVLVIDADLLYPQVDMLLDLKPGTMLGKENRSSGFDLALKEESSVCLNRDSLRKTLVESEKKHLFALFPANDLNSYEQYNPEALFRVLRLGQAMFDFIFVICSRFIYDAFTCLGFVASELVLVPLAADFPTFRHINRLLDFLSARQICDWEKIRYIAYSYQGSSDLSWGTMDELSGGRLYGCISQNAKRLALRNEKKSYAMSMGKKNIDEYKALVRKLEIDD